MKGDERKLTPSEKRKIKFLDENIRRVPDYPKKGILFYDISTLLKNGKAFKTAVDLLVSKLKKYKFDKVVAIESRGFIFGGAIAYKFGVGLVIVRKEGKLPAETLSYSYGLEYGEATVEIHTDAIKKGEKVIVLDDLIATGGTAEATCKLVQDLGGKPVACAFLIELVKLGGAKKLPCDVVSLIKYDGNGNLLV